MEDAGFAKLDVAASTFSGNQSIGGNGANASGDGNFVGGGSGAIRSDGSALTVSDSFFSGNVVRGGNGGQAGIDGNGGNGSDNDGGAISVTTFFGDSSLEMTNTTVINNTVIAGHGGIASGGGLAIDIGDTGNNAEVTLTRSRFVRNSAISDVSAVGGAIANTDGGTLKVETRLLHFQAVAPQGIWISCRSVLAS